MVGRCALLVLLLVVGAAPAAAAAACDGPVAVLVDRSASMADHDPHGALRLAVAGALDGARAPRLGDVVAPFDAAPVQVTAVVGRWTDAISAAMAGGDRGPTDLDAALAGGAALAGAPRLIVLTDGEAQLAAAPPALRGGLVLTLGGAPGDALRTAARAAGGTAEPVRDGRAARAAVAAWCAGVASRAARAVVLIGGLREQGGELRGVRDVAGCAPGGAVASWCRAFVRSGARVWAPSEAPGGRGGAVVDTTGPLERNGQRFARWLQRGPGSGGVLVGHSMGGLVAHAGLAEGARAHGLITVGTPHAGSFGADAYLAALAAARGCLVLCPVAGATLLVAAARARARFGAALVDLTRDRRTGRAALGQVPVPFAAWASAVNRAPAGARGDGGYVWPNDGIVGRGSATGVLAGLRPDLVVADGAARHSSAVPPRAAPTQLSAPEVADWLVATAADMAPGGRLALRARAAAAPRAVVGADGRRRPPRAAALLRPVDPLVPGSAPRIVSGDAVVVATAPIGLLCDDVPVAPVEVVPGLWYLDLGSLGCVSLSRPDAAAAPLAGDAVLIGAAPEIELAGRERLLALRRARGGWTITLELVGDGEPELLRGARRVRLRPAEGAEWPGRRRFRARLGARGPRTLTVRVSDSGAGTRVAALTLP